MVHHALHNLLGPRFDPLFADASFANRIGRGTHRAIDRFQALAKRYRYVLRADIVKHFPSIDHAILRQTLARRIPEPDVMALVDLILDSGDAMLADECRTHWFVGDDLLAACRPRGLPIGNLTSQFWSNCYLHPFDAFVGRELRCRAYVRYVDDIALFSDSKEILWEWKRRMIERLARLRLHLHEGAAQVSHTTAGTPWLGFVVFPGHRLVKARKVVAVTRKLRARHRAYRTGRIDHGALLCSVRGWVEHVRHGSTWGLRCHVLSRRWPGLRPR